MAIRSKNVYIRLLSYVLPYWWAFLLAVLGSILFSSVDAYVTHFMKPLLDIGFVQRNQAFLKRLPYVIMAIFLIRGVASFIARYFMARVGRDVVKTLRNEMFNHLLRLPASYYDLATSGQLLSKIIYNVDQVASACTNAVTTAVQALALIIGLFVVMFLINWHLTILYVSVAPLIAIIIRYTAKRMRRLSGKVQNYLGDATHISEEAIEGYKVVKIFGGQNYEAKKFAHVNQENRNQALKIILTESVSTMLVMTVGAIVLAVTIFLVTSDKTGVFRLSAGGFVAMIGAMLAIFKPMRDFTSVNNVIQQGLAGAESVFQLLDSEIENDQGKIKLENISGKIVYKNVGFKYKTQVKDALSEINLIINPGEMVALVGRSGSGKTTLASLLPRFYEVSDGEIQIDGHNITDVTRQSLRANLGIVNQNITLFNDTIAKNIAYGLFDSVTTQQIARAVKLANADEFIDKLPKGLDTIVGDSGVLLSGGQRQRLAIARAILKDAPILILDEATSALDTESERKIQQALNTLTKGRTTLVIAHRLSTIEHADKIIVLDDGIILESGTHLELLNKKGQYARLHELQFRNNEKNSH